MQQPWLITPMAFVMEVIIAFNFVGDGLHDAADPFTREPPGATAGLNGPWRRPTLPTVRKAGRRALSDVSPPPASHPCSVL